MAIYGKALNGSEVVPVRMENSIQSAKLKQGLWGEGRGRGCCKDKNTPKEGWREERVKGSSEEAV